MKILLTGAHFTPAVAVIEQLKKYPDTRIVYVGRQTTQEGDFTQSVESQIIPELGVKFIPIITGRFQREFTRYTLLSLLKIPVGILQSLYIILNEKPDAILSFGGYVAVPIVVMGWLFSIPIMVHEQTLVSGLANKISSYFTDKMAVSFLSKNPKAILTGNPIRRKIISTKLIKHEGTNILILGGNQGSHIINLAVEKSLGKLTSLCKIIHVTGENKYKDFERLRKKQTDKYVVKKWVGDELAKILSKTDLVICRAGINTLTELSYLGLPAVVIPIPYIFNDEQNKNAEYFKDLGLVQILPQSRLSASSLLMSIKLMLKDLPNLKKQSIKSKHAIIPDSAKRLALETIIIAIK